MTPLWDDINQRRKVGKDPVVKAFEVLDAGSAGEPTKAMKRADRDMAAALAKDDPRAVLMATFVLVKHGRARPARSMLRARDELCREYGDLAYMRGEAELRAGFGPVAAVRARRWLRTARRLGVSSTVKLTPLRQDAQAVVLLAVGFLVAVTAASLRPLARSWRGVGLVAGFLVAGPGLLRQLAYHRAYAVLLVILFVGLAIIGLK